MATQRLARDDASGAVDMPTSVPFAGGNAVVTSRASGRSHAVPILQAYALAVMVVPSDMVIKAVGAGGYFAALIGMGAFVAFLVATLFGFHNPLRHRHPVRSVLLLLWLSALVSYVAMYRPDRTPLEMQSADRLLMQLAAITGVALVAAECLSSLSEIRRVLRVLTWGAAFCGVVAALQFWVSVDLSVYLRHIPGFTLNHDNLAIWNRSGLNRVSGTATNPIELGVAAGMLLPLAIYLALYDTERTPRMRWTPVALIAIAIPTSVSRSGILSVALALSVLVVLMPPRQRLFALGAVPFALCGVFVSAHGLIGTLTTFFTAGKSDDSVAARVGDYPLVEKLVQQRPWFGRGGGTWLPANPLDIFDNQYLKVAVELGLVGVVALLALFLVPMISALVARRRTNDPELRLLCAALAGACLSATFCSATFDSFSFPMFPSVLALVIGLIGACTQLAPRSGPATHDMP